MPMRGFANASPHDFGPGIARVCCEGPAIVAVH